MAEKSIPEVLNCLFSDLYFPSRIFLLFLEPNEVSVDLFSIRPIRHQDFVQPLLCPNLLVSMHQAKNTFWFRVVKWIAKIAIIANWEEIAISQITQLNFLDGRNCENCENDEIEEFGSRFRKYLGGWNFVTSNFVVFYEFQAN